MEAREVLRLRRAGFRPVRRLYVVVATLAAAAAIATELLVIQRNATEPEACFKPWRPALAFILHALLTALRLVWNTVRKLRSYYGTYRTGVGILSLIVISYFFKTVLDVMASLSREGLESVVSNKLLDKYIILHDLEWEHVLRHRTSSNSTHLARGLPQTEWRYVGESITFKCSITCESPPDLLLFDDDILWMHNKSVIWRDDPRYKTEIFLDDLGPQNNGMHVYTINMELTINFITEWHFGEYDCISVNYLAYGTRSFHNGKNCPSKQIKYPRRHHVWKRELRPSELDLTKQIHWRIGRGHLKQVMPEKRVMVIPIGGVMIVEGFNQFMSKMQLEDIFYEYKVNGEEITTRLESNVVKSFLCSPFIYVFLWYMRGHPFPIPFVDMFSHLGGYSFRKVLQFPPEAFGEHKLTLYLDTSNKTTGERELKEVEYPVTYVFKPSPPILMEIYFRFMEIDDVTVSSDLSDPFVSGLVNFCLKAEALLLLLILVAVAVLVVVFVKVTIMRVLVPLWHAIVLLGFHPPPEETLADICTAPGQDPAERYDVFVSYASEEPADRDFVHGVLLPRLRLLGLSVCLPENERAPNRSEMTATSQLIQACRYYVVVVTQSYIRSAICNRLELPFILARFRFREVEDDHVLLVRLRPCIIPGGLRCSLPVVDLTQHGSQGQLDDVIRAWSPRGGLGTNPLPRLLQ